MKPIRDGSVVMKLNLAFTTGAISFLGFGFGQPADENIRQVAIIGTYPSLLFMALDIEFLSFANRNKQAPGQLGPLLLTSCSSSQPRLAFASISQCLRKRIALAAEHLPSIRSMTLPSGLSRAPASS